MSKENFAFRGDSQEFVLRIAKKHELSTEGIIQITNSSDVKQVRNRLMNKVHEVKPGATLMWSPPDKAHVLSVFTNDNLDIFGFAKIILPGSEEADGEVIMVPFHLVSPLNKVEKLF